MFGCSEYEGIFLDYSRQQATGETIEKLLKLAEVTPLSPFHFGGVGIALSCGNLGSVWFFIGCEAKGED